MCNSELLEAGLQSLFLFFQSVVKSLKVKTLNLKVVQVVKCNFLSYGKDNVISASKLCIHVKLRMEDLLHMQEKAV